MIVSVEEGTIFDHKGHLQTLVHHLEVAFLVNFRDLHLLVVAGQDIHLVVKVFDELLGWHVFYFDLTNVECGTISFPHLVLHQVVLFVV